MPVWLQVGLSILLVIVVLWWMWLLPRRGEALFGWAPPLAFISTWSGLLALVFSMLMFVLPYPDVWVVVTFLLLEPLAVALGTLVLWIYRGYEVDAQQSIQSQRLQAQVGIVQGLVAIAISYAFVMSHKTIFTPVGQ